MRRRHFWRTAVIATLAAIIGVINTLSYSR